jgi:large-conductance mechanosensitive channel
MQDLQKLIDFITRSNWLILLVGGMIGLAFTPVNFAMGIISGGLIAAINFHLLRRTLKKMFHPESVSVRGRSIVGNVLVKYYIRFAISGLLIFLLISKHIVHPVGLLAGLSVVVASVFLATALELKKIFFKEAV